jgi:cellulose synthase/poly-beta-1,6-N-acetylglucosamine synthase-like glycosyltransferase
MRPALEALAIVALTYFVVLNGLYLVFTAIAWNGITEHRRQRVYAPTDEAFSSPLTPPISILLPAYNEEAGIVESVRSLFGLHYPEFEVVVVNDGSSDATIERFRAAFDLVPVRKALRAGIPTAPVRGSSCSRRHPELSVVDKENGGKADALNCGVNAARYPYVCAIDADAMLEEDALIRVAKPMLEDPDRVAATGGIVRIANGCVVEHGRVTTVGLPHGKLATMQVVEYFRAFLVGRVGWSRIRSLLIISGAFGLFRRSLVEAVGGNFSGIRSSSPPSSPAQSRSRSCSRFSAWRCCSELSCPSPRSPSRSSASGGTPVDGKPRGYSSSPCSRTSAAGSSTTSGGCRPSQTLHSDGVTGAT